MRTPGILILLIMLTAPTAFCDVTVEGKRGAWTMKVDGEPFYVQGITWTSGAYDETRWRNDFETMKRLQANTVRTWGVGKDTAKLLDMADEYGIKVMLGLWLRHGRAGAEDDDEFDWIHDAPGRQVQWDDTIKAVEEFKKHPALLCWGVANEVVLNIATEEEKQAYAQFLGKLTTEIKKLDPHHPIASVSAWSISWPYWREHAPAIDIYGINTYGYGAAAIPGEQERLGVDKPYLICEFGATGEWETQADKFGVKLDPAESQKLSIIADGWNDLIHTHAGHNLGGFVFHFGSTLDHTGLWLGFRCDNLWRPAYHGTMSAFTGKLPDDRLPVIQQFRFSKDHGRAGEWVPVTLEANDPESKPLNIRFMFNERRGDRHYRDGVHPLESRKNDAGSWEVKLPVTVEPGGIKVYVLVDDGVNLAIAQYSVRVDQ